MPKVDASTLRIELGQPVAGALNLPPSFAPCLERCFANATCQRSVLEKAPNVMWRQAMAIGGAPFFGADHLASAIVTHGCLSVDVDSLMDPPKSLNVALQNFVNRLENAFVQGRQRLMNIAQSKQPYAALAKTIYQAVMDPSTANLTRLQQAVNPLPRRLMAGFLHEYITQTVRDLWPSFRLDSVQTYLNTPTTALFEVAYYASTVRARDKTFAQSVADAKKMFPDHQIIALVGGGHALHTASLATTMLQLTHDEL